MSRWLLIFGLVFYKPVLSQSLRLLRYNTQLAIKQKDWSRAAQYLKLQTAKDSLNVQVRYDFACVLFEMNELKPAKQQFKRLVAMRSNLFETHYQLAQINKMLSLNEESLAEFTAFLKKSTIDTLRLFSDPCQRWGELKSIAYFRKRAQQEQAILRLGKDTHWTHLNLVNVTLTSSINSEFTEIPVSVQDSSHWNFVRWNTEYQNLQKTEVSQLFSVSGYEQQVSVKPFIDSLSFTKDTVVFVMPSASKNLTLVKRLHQGILEWGIRNTSPSDWKPLKNFGFQDLQMLHPTFFKTQDTLYLAYSSNRPGGIGSWDIWISALDTNGRLLYTQNAGTCINTPENEFSPFFDATTHCLYFSSTGHCGIGGWDVFFAKAADFSKKEFYPPQHAGIPINSPAHDLYFQKTLDSKYLFLSSNRLSGSKIAGCCMDVFMYKADTLITQNNKDRIVLRSNDSLVYIQSMERYLPLNVYFDNDQPLKTQKIHHYAEYFNAYQQRSKAYLTQCNLTDTIQIQALKYFFNQTLTNSFNDLIRFKTQLKTFLEQQTEVHIAVQAFASPLAENAYNLDLSRRRIESLKCFLLEDLPDSTVKFLKIDEQPLGERMLSGISDSRKELQKSVYSPEAIHERKVQIQHIRIQKNLLKP